MSFSFLKTTTVGDLAGEPKTFTGKSGSICISGALAVRRFHMDMNNVPQTNLTFIDWEYWCPSEDAPKCNFKKGDRLEMTGDLYERIWQTDTGVKRRKHYLKAKSIKKLEEK